jgi:hypothetical protein
MVFMTDTNHDPINDQKNRGGRPRRADGPAFDINEVDRLLVQGEAGPDGRAHYPSQRELAARFGVSPSTIAEYSRAHNCQDRRRNIEAQVREIADRKVIDERALQLATEKSDLLRVLDKYFVAFEGALRDGRVRCDDPADFNTMCRLRTFLMDGEKPRGEATTGVSLEELQERHRRYLEKEAEMQENPGLTGMVEN